MRCPSNVSMPTIVELLRTRTADLHTAVESELPLMSADLDQESYRQTLLGFWNFHSAWEKKTLLVPSTEMSDLIRSRSRLSLLREDLLALGMPLPVAGKVSLPPLESEAQVMGSMYVMEGSTLGGQWIARHLAQHFGWEDGQRYRYFTAYGDQTGRKWKEFCGVLASTPEDWHEAMIVSAQQTFRAFGECLRAAQGISV